MKRSPASSSATGGLVYSTDAGRMCPACRQPLAQCRCKEAAAAAALARGDGVVRVSREVGGRGGKTVSVVRGVPLDAGGIAELAKKLKALCGTGGTAKDGVIEIQGDHRDRIVTHLEAAGYKVKRAGG